MNYNMGNNNNRGGNNQNCGCGDRMALLNKFRAYDFAAIEASLYLDAYDCPKALEYWNEVSGKAQELKEKYESLYGPLTQAGVNCENGWTWVDAPWPWEVEAN